VAPARYARGEPLVVHARGELDLLESAPSQRARVFFEPRALLQEPLPVEIGQRARVRVRDAVAEGCSGPRLLRSKRALFCGWTYVVSAAGGEGGEGKDARRTRMRG